jgi:hypothetical protein
MGSSPPVLANARVLEYALLDNSVTFSGRTLLSVDGKELGPVPCLAICQDLDSNDILLLHCDKDWNVLGAACYPSIEAAKAKAEQIYPGVSACWKPTAFTEAKARDYLTQLWAASCQCTRQTKASAASAAEFRPRSRAWWKRTACASAISASPTFSNHSTSKSLTADQR